MLWWLFIGNTDNEDIDDDIYRTIRGVSASVEHELRVGLMSGMMTVSKSCRNCAGTGSGLQSQCYFQRSISWRPNSCVLCWYWIPREKELIIMKTKGIGGSIYTHLFFYPDNDKLTDYLFDPCRIDYRKLVSTLDFLAWKVHSITVISADFALFSSKDLFNNRFLWFLASYMALDLARFMKTAPAGSWRPHTLNWLH